MTDLKIVDINEECKQHVGTLSERIDSVICDFIEDNKVTFAEVVGILEIKKIHFMQDYGLIPEDE